MTGAAVFISERAAAAVQRYVRQVEKSHTCRSGGTHVFALERLRTTRAALIARELAILDMVAVQGREVDDVALATRQPVRSLELLFADAALHLADHYDACRLIDEALVAA